MNLTKTSLLITSLISSPFAFANSGIDFSNSKQHYSGFEVGYGSNDFAIGLQYAKQLNTDWSMLSAYNNDSNFDNHQLKLDFQRSDGLGLAFKYNHDQDYRSEGLRANDYEFGMYNNKALTKKFTVTPQISLGTIEHQKMSSSVYYTTASLDMSYKLRPDVWVGVTPEYTYSLGKVNEKNGHQSTLRDWDYAAELGYQFNKSSALVYSYHYDKCDNLSLFSFKHKY